MSSYPASKKVASARRVVSSRCEVLIRIALLQRKTLTETTHIKMLKMALLDCAVNEKCCSVEGERGICPLFSSPRPGIYHPRQKKC